MSSPNYPDDTSRPAGSLAVGLFREKQLQTADDAKEAMSGGVLGAALISEEVLKLNVKDPIEERPTFTQTPVNIALWAGMDPKEHATVPRSQLIHGTAARTSTGTDTGSRQLNVIPDYQPSGNNTDWAEIGFIRVQRDADLRYVGFMTGDSQTFAGISGAYLGVYSVNTTTGLLTRLTNTLAATNIKSLITDTNTETRFDMGLTIEASQDDVFAVVLLQDTTAIQTAASLMCVRITELNRYDSGAYPRRPYAYAGPSPMSSLPSTISAANQHWDSSTKLPFFYLREA